MNTQVIATETVVERMAGDGRQVRIDVVVTGDFAVQVRAHLDGQWCYGDLRKLQQSRRHTDGRLITHWCGSSSTAAIAVFEDEAELLLAAVQRLREAHPKPVDLVQQRRDLLTDIRIAHDCDRERRDRAWEREDEAGAMRHDAEGKIAAATQALADFDAAHPEIVAQWDHKAARQYQATLQDQLDYQGE